MYFGYINRNYVETPAVAIGADNKIEPGAPDQGQPTVFGVRIHRQAFSVAVPKDWGKKELVWSVTVHGETARAVAWLQPEWEIDPIYGGKARSEESLKNKPPTIAVDAKQQVTLPNTLTLAATVTDDGLPVPRKGPRKAAVGQETPPSLKPEPNQPEIFLNVPQVARGRGRGGRSGSGRDVDGVAGTGERHLRACHCSGREWESGGHGNVRETGHLCAPRNRE